MLSYYVEWHMIEAWRPLLFADEDQAAKVKRDPVAPAKAISQFSDDVKKIGIKAAYIDGQIVDA